MIKYRKYEEDPYEFEQLLDGRYLLNYDYTVELTGIVITIPKNFYMYDTVGGLIGDYLLVEPISNTFEATYEIDYHPYETLEILNQFSSFEYKQKVLFKRTKHNGLEAYHATYTDGDSQCYEMRFQIEGSGKRKTEFVLRIETKDNNIKEIKESPEFKKLLNGIRKFAPSLQDSEK